MGTYITDGDYMSGIGTNSDGSSINKSLPDWLNNNADKQTTLDSVKLKAEIDNHVNEVMMQIINKN